MNNLIAINRISAWVTGYRNVQKALLFALLQPNEELKQLQDESHFTKLMVLQEELKTLPFGDVWDEYCRVCGKPIDGAWFGEATAEKMRTARLVVWSLHGIYGAGRDLDETFGLIETAEKAAEIYMKIAHLPRINTITDDMMHQLEARFGVKSREGYLA